MISSSSTEIRRDTPEAPWTYALLDRRQREIAERVRGGGEGALLLSEVAPVITMGRRTAASDLLFPASFYESRGIEIYATDRGGLATYHGPGQWVLFVVDRLDRLTGDSRGVRKAVDGLLEIARRVGAKYRADAHLRAGAELGAWSSRGKFGAVGVHIENRVLLHGLSLNAYRTEQSFLGLRPCGLDAPVDFLLDGPAGFDALGGEIVEASSEVFGRAQTNGHVKIRG
jgi:lipoyl(octanoyl) transferase